MNSEAKVRARIRRWSPWVLALCTVMTLASVAGVATPGSSAAGSPSGQAHPALCTCACYGTCGVTCPEGTVSFWIASVTYPTPTTIVLTVGVNVATSSFAFQWGTTTSYGKTWSESPAPTTVLVTIGPLNAGTTYYYKITGSASCYNSGSYTGSVPSFGHVYGSFTASGAFPVWNFCILSVCAPPCGNPTQGHQTVISLGDAISTWVASNDFQSSIWENQSNGGTGLNTYWGCSTSYSGGSVTWGSILTCDGNYQERTFSWDPSFTQTWIEPLYGDPSSTVTYNIQVEVCAANPITVYMTWSSTVLVDWVGIAYEVATFNL